MVRLALLVGFTSAGPILPLTLLDGEVSMEKLMAFNNQKNGIGLEMFINGNKGAQEHLPLIMEMIKSNRQYEDPVDASANIDEAKGNIDQAFMAEPAPVQGRSASVDEFTEEKENADRAAKLILENPAFAGKKIDPYVLAQAFGADESFLPPPPTNSEFNCRNSCRLQCDYLDGKRKCNFFCGLVC